MSAAVQRRLRDAAATDRPFDTALTLPGFVYHDAAVFDLEHRKIYSQWFCVGHISALRNPGDCKVVELGNDSLIVVRDQHERLNAFHNVCRHRGTRLLNPGEAPCRHIVCPYHAWRYRTDGQLANAPGMEQRADFNPAHHALNPVRHAIRLGFVFVCMDMRAPTLADVYDDLPDLSAFELPHLARGALHDYNVAANWKLVCENFNECYHCAGAHPQLHRLSQSADLAGFDHRGKNFTGGPMGIEPPYTSMTRDGKTSRPLLPGFQPDQARLTYYFNLFPNLLLSIAPDYVMAHYLFPRAARTTYVQTEWLFRPEVADAPEFDPSDAVDFWEPTNQQDWALCQNAQAGLVSTGHKPGPYHPQERCVHDFDRWYLRAVLS